MGWRYKYFILVLVLAGVLFLASGCISKPEQKSAGTPDSVTLTYYTEQFPPYNYQENGTLKGVAVDLLGEITGKMGSRVTPDQVHLVPWTEGYQAALTRKNTVLFSTYRLTEREQSFKWAKPQDREEMARSVIENLGGKIKGFWYALGDYDIVMIETLPDNASAAAHSIAATASGAFKLFKTTPLLSVNEGIEAMKKASKAGLKKQMKCHPLLSQNHPYPCHRRCRTEDERITDLLFQSHKRHYA